MTNSSINYPAKMTIFEVYNRYRIDSPMKAEENVQKESHTVQSFGPLIPAWCALFTNMPLYLLMPIAYTKGRNMSDGRLY